MYKMKYVYFIAILGVNFLLTGNKWLQVEKNLKRSVKLEDRGSFIKEINKCRSSKLKYFPSGQTPLTLVVKNIGSSKGSFFCVILAWLKSDINTKNKFGEYPLQIALEKGLMSISICLATEGADFNLINRNVLEKAIKGKVLVNNLVQSYIDYYCEFLVYLNGQFKERPSLYHISLDILCYSYFDRCKFRCKKDKVSLLKILKEGGERINKKIGSKKTKSKSLVWAYSYFVSMFCKNNKYLNRPKLVSRCFSKLISLVQQVHVKESEVFLNNLFSKSKKNNYIDTKVVCYK